MPITGMSRAAGRTDTKTKTKVVKNKTKAAAKRSAKASSAKPAAASARTKRKPVSQSAMADAERYALALESINENLYDWDIENDTIYFAPGLFKILGLSAAQMRKPSDWTNRI